MVLDGNYKSSNKLLFSIEIEESGQAYIIEMASGDLVFLNDKKLLANQKKDIHSLDVISLINTTNQKVFFKLKRFLVSSIEEAFCLGQICLDSNDSQKTKNPVVIMDNQSVKQQKKNSNEIKANFKIETAVLNLSKDEKTKELNFPNVNQNILPSQENKEVKEYAKKSPDQENREFFDQSYSCPICWN